MARASTGPPYSQGGTGKYGFESDQTLDHSASLLMKMNGEHLGTGAGTVGAISTIIAYMDIFRISLSSAFLIFRIWFKWFSPFEKL